MLFTRWLEPLDMVPFILVEWVEKSKKHHLLFFFLRDGKIIFDTTVAGSMFPWELGTYLHHGLLLVVEKSNRYLKNGL